MGRNALLLAKMECADGRTGAFIGAGPNPHVLFEEAQDYLLRQGVPGFIKPCFFPPRGVTGSKAVSAKASTSFSKTQETTSRTSSGRSSQKWRRGRIAP